MIRVVFMLDDERERERMMPQAPRMGDHIMWQPDPDGYHQEHTVTGVLWSLDTPEGPHAVVSLTDRTMNGKSVNGQSAPWPGEGA